MVTSDRRSESRPQSPSRRSARRPALWLNVVVLFLGLTVLAGARQHRLRLDAKFERIVQTHAASPYPIAKIRSDLAAMELNRESLDRELTERLAMARGFDAAEFYLAVDTANRKLRFHFGPETVRETDVVIKQSVPLKAGVTVIGTLVDQPWAKYVILLPNGYVIHSPPPPQGPVTGARAGSFMIAEEEMRAIWPRISATTRVYIY
jgi:hypothetical protein